MKKNFNYEILKTLNAGFFPDNDVPSWQKCSRKMLYKMLSCLLFLEKFEYFDTSIHRLHIEFPQTLFETALNKM